MIGYCVPLVCQYDAIVPLVAVEMMFVTSVVVRPELRRDAAVDVDVDFGLRRRDVGVGPTDARDLFDLRDEIALRDRVQSA